MSLKNPRGRSPRASAGERPSALAGGSVRGGQTLELHLRGYRVAQTRSTDPRASVKDL